MARWTGLREDEKAFMEDTYSKLQRFGSINFQQRLTILQEKIDSAGLDAHN
jgi:hypothetical protein